MIASHSPGRPPCFVGVFSQREGSVILYPFLFPSKPTSPTRNHPPRLRLDEYILCLRRIHRHCRWRRRRKNSQNRHGCIPPPRKTSPRRGASARRNGPRVRFYSILSTYAILPIPHFQASGSARRVMPPPTTTAFLISSTISTPTPPPLSARQTIAPSANTARSSTTFLSAVIRLAASQASLSASSDWTYLKRHSTTHEWWHFGNKGPI